MIYLLALQLCEYCFVLLPVLLHSTLLKTVMCTFFTNFSTFFYFLLFGDKSNSNYFLPLFFFVIGLNVCDYENEIFNVL